MSERPSLAPAPAFGQDSPTTRERVLDAAVRCILEEGFYRASSNRIAASAGVSWGVIQHHFGTREGLLLAVFERSSRRLGETLTDASVTGSDVAERLESLADVIWSHYRQPDFLASVQILLNLSRDPRTAERTVQVLEGLDRTAAAGWRRLLAEVFADTEAPRDLAASLFDIMRGLAIGEVISDAIPSSSTRPRAPSPGTGRTDPSRRALIRALTLLVEEEPARGRPPGGLHSG
jgi:AcrR family transcriptional regulator